MRQVDVFVNDIKAGRLTEKLLGRDYTFAYDSAYITTDMPPVSVTLPKRAEAYESQVLFPFFTNLLFEGANRKVVCRELHIDENDFFGMLMATDGMDIIGAVSIKKVDHDENK